MKKIFKDLENGKIISEVTELTPEVEVETILHGKPQAEALRIYLDADNRNSYCPNRPCVRIQFAADGRTVDSIVLFNDPEGAEFVWQR